MLFMCLHMFYIAKPFKLQLFVLVKFFFTNFRTNNMCQSMAVSWACEYISSYYVKIEYRKVMQLSHLRREWSSGTSFSCFHIKAASLKVFVANNLLLLLVLQKSSSLTRRHNLPQNTGISFFDCTYVEIREQNNKFRSSNILPSNMTVPKLN